VRKFRILGLALAVSAGLLAGSATATVSPAAKGVAGHVKIVPKCKSKAYAKKHKALCKKCASTAFAKKHKALCVVKATAKPKPTASAVSFAGSYSGQASTKISGSTATISANGTGSGSVIGAGKITGNGTADTSQQPCVPFSGTGSMSGSGGTISFSVPTSSSGCGDEGGHTFTLKGTFTVTGGSGSFAKAKGSLRFTGTFDHDAGTFSIKVTGSLTK
jgi:hypothetical protein